MRKSYGKRLNNKGFTLIELLAVVVILAVVMGIAMNSVLSSMNKSRGGSLSDSAMVIANGFNQKYTESLVDGVPSNVYGDVLTDGYNFQSNAIYYLDKGLADSFNISEDGYAFVNSDTNTNVSADSTATPKTGITTSTAMKNSFVYFDASNGKFVVCLVANKNGSYFVDNYKLDAVSNIVTLKIGSTDVAVTVPIGEMFACSDGLKSW